jgi:hypothetical protein
MNKEHIPMRMIRAFAAGLGTGYLIWSDNGRKLVDKVRERAMAQRSSRASRPSNYGSTEAAVMPTDLAVPTVGADPLLGASAAVNESTRTARRAG